MNGTDLCSCGSVPATSPNKDCERCCLVWFAMTTKRMREAQKSFFKTRKASDMQTAKQLEKLIDAAIERLENIPSQQELF